MAQPDFIIVGAMKSGTSTLAAQIGAQPGLFMTTPKEPNFFSDDAIWSKGPDWYHGLFANAAPTDLKGEASTHYTKYPRHPHTLERMQALLETHPRIIYVIRNPIDRAVSHFIHAWSEGETDRDISKAFENTPDFVDFGCYGMQIAPFIEAFGKERIYLTSLEAMTANPQDELTRATRFLGYGRTPIWQTERARENVSSQRTRKLPLHGLIVDNPVATALRRTLVPKALRNRIRQRQTFGDRPELPEALRTRLQDRFLEDRALLARLFPDHPALRACYPFAPS
ncbi:MAG: sulfotransferase domain-containing protein [Pseudomonadota bacterium]